MWATNTQAQEKPSWEVLEVLNGLEQMLSGLPHIRKQLREQSNCSFFPVRYTGS